MAKWLPDDRRAVLALAGEAPADFLQGLVTADMRRLAPGRAVYGALLTPQGKFLFDFVAVAGAEGAVLLDVAADRAAEVERRLVLYRLRRRIAIGPTPLRVTLAWDGAEPPAGLLAVPDPRDPALGLRLYAEAPVPVPGAEPADRAAYDALRVRLGIPEAGAELLPEETYILEAGFERLGGVDFRKGCYVGQEVTARMKHRAELRRGLVRVRVEGAAPPPGTPVMAGDRPAGLMGSAVGGEGLALLRLDRLAGPLTAGAARLRPAEPAPPAG